MTRTLLLLLLLLPLCGKAQQPNRQGLEAHWLLDQGDTVHFYVYNPERLAKSKIFLFLQGSQPFPMISSTDSQECCFNNFPKAEMKHFPKEYAFVYIQKVGVPYYANIDHFTPGARFNERNNVLDRAAVADKVLNYLLAKVYPKASVVAVMGHSEGSDVAARLSAINRRVTHLCFASGNGTPQIFNDVLFMRRKMHLGELSAAQAQVQMDSLFLLEDRVFKEPDAVDKHFNGDSYKWHHAVNQPAIDNLLKLDIPILLTIGSNDANVPVESTDYIKAEFVRLQKHNLTYKVFLNCDHSYVEHLQDGQTKDRWLELFDEFARFIEGHPKR